MPDPSLNDLLQKLLEKTREERVNWLPAAQAGSFRCVFADYTVVVSRWSNGAPPWMRGFLDNGQAEQLEDFPTVAIEISNDYGDVLESEARALENAGTLGSLYTAIAHKRVRHDGNAIRSLMAALEG